MMMVEKALKEVSFTLESGKTLAILVEQVVENQHFTADLKNV